MQYHACTIYGSRPPGICNVGVRLLGVYDGAQIVIDLLQRAAETRDDYGGGTRVYVPTYVESWTFPSFIIASRAAGTLVYTKEARARAAGRGEDSLSIDSIRIYARIIIAHAHRVRPTKASIRRTPMPVYVCGCACIRIQLIFLGHRTPAAHANFSFFIHRRALSLSHLHSSSHTLLFTLSKVRARISPSLYIPPRFYMYTLWVRKNAAREREFEIARSRSYMGIGAPRTRMIFRRGNLYDARH